MIFPSLRLQWVRFRSHGVYDLKIDSPAQQWNSHIHRQQPIALSQLKSLPIIFCSPHNGPLTRYAKLRVAHAPGIPGTFSLSLRVSDPDMHGVTHVPWRMPGSLTSGFLWSRWRRKRSRHSRHMHNPYFYASDKRPTWLSGDEQWGVHSST